MTLPVKPILSSLRHHRLTTTLLVLQVALTCAIVINTGAQLVERVARITLPSGLPEDELSLISVRGLNEADNALAQQQTDLAALRAIHDVRNAVVLNNGSLPLSRNVYGTGGCISQQALDRAVAANGGDGIAGCVSVSAYGGSPGLVDAMGLHLASGRDFTPSEQAPDDDERAVIVSRTLAAQLWPDQSPIGKSLYSFSAMAPVPVVGVIDDVLAPELGGSTDDRMVMLTSQNQASLSATYLLRSAPGDRQHVLHEAADALAKAGPSRLISEDRQRTYTQVRRDYFQRDVTMLGLLIASSLALLFVTALGIGGLANFWVGQRTRQIGIRRAIGATRSDILRHFQAENFMIVGAGVALGMVLCSK